MYFLNVEILMYLFCILFKFCIKADPHCLKFLCNFGKMENGKEASVHLQLEGRTSILEMASLKYSDNFVDKFIE